MLCKMRLTLSWVTWLMYLSVSLFSKYLFCHFAYHSAAVGRIIICCRVGDIVKFSLGPSYLSISAISHCQDTCKHTITSQQWELKGLSTSFPASSRQCGSSPRQDGRDFSKTHRVEIKKLWKTKRWPCGADHFHTVCLDLRSFLEKSLT